MGGVHLTGVIGDRQVTGMVTIMATGGVIRMATGLAIEQVTGIHKEDLHTMAAGPLQTMYTTTGHKVSSDRAIQTMIRRLETG